MRKPITVLLSGIAVPALAHPGHGSETIGVIAEFAHFFSDATHWPAMLAVGLCAGIVAGIQLRGLWRHRGIGGGNRPGRCRPCVEPALNVDRNKLAG